MLNFSFFSSYLFFILKRAPLFLFALFTFFILVPHSAFAAVKTWDGGGANNNWSTAANWSGDTVPTSADVATFDGTSTKNATIDSSFAGTVAGIDINSGYTGVITQARSITITGTSGYDQADGTFTGATQTFDINDGGFSLSGGTFTPSTGAFTIERSFSITGGTYNTASTAYTFDGTGGLDLATLTCSGTFNTITGASSVSITKTVSANFTLASGCTLTASVSTTTADITIDSGATLTTTGAFVSRALTNNGSFTTAANTFQTNGDTTFNGTTNNLSSATSFDVNDGSLIIGAGITVTYGGSALSIERNYTVDATATFDLTGKTLTFDGNAAAENDSTTLSCSGNFNTITGATVTITKTTANNFTLTSGCTLTASVSTTSGDIIIDSGATFTSSGAFTSRSFTNNGSFTAAANTFQTNGDTTFNGSTNNLSSATSFDVNDGSLIIGAGITVTYGGSALSIEREYTVDATATFDLTGKTLTFDGNAGGEVDSTTLSCSGNFNTITGASVSITKTTSNNFTLSSGCTLTASVSSNGVDFFINSGATFISTGAFTSRSFTNSGSFTAGANTFQTNAGATFSGTTNDLSSATSFDINGGDLTIGAGITVTYDGSALSVEQNYNVDATATFDVTGKTLTFDGDAGGNTDSTTLSCTGDFNTLTGVGSVVITKIINNDFTVPNGCTVTASVTGGAVDIIIDAGGTFNSTGTFSTFTLTNSGTFTAGAITHTIASAISSSGTSDFSSATTLDFNNASLTVSAGTFTPPADITLERNLTQTGGTFDLSGTTLTLDGLDDADDATIAYTGTIGNLVINKSNATSNTTFANSITVSGNFTRTNGPIVNPSAPYTLYVGGDFSVATTDTFAGSNLSLTFNGSGTQSLSNAGGATISSEFNVNKTAGTAQLAGAITVSSATCNIVEGVFDVNGNAFTCATGFTVEDGGTLRLRGSESITTPTLDTGSTVSYKGDGDGASDTYTITTLKTTYHHLAIESTDSSDTYQLGAALDVNGNVSITGGTLDLSASNYQLNVGGNWSKSGGTFNGRSGTVVMDGTSQTISGTNTFYAFTKSVSSAATLTFPAGATTTFTGTMTLTGVAGQLLSVVSSSAGTVASIDPQGSRSTQYLNVQDMSNINATAIDCTTGCTNSGNNTNWSFPASAGITVSAISGNTTEAGGTATFTVVLDTLPSASVSIDVSSSDTGEGTVSTSTLTFTTANWDTPQTVTVTGVNDDLDDGNIAYSIVLATATSSDGNYNGIDPGDVSVTNTDNDASGFTVSAISGNTSEAGGTATFTVVLTAEPTADVSTGISSNDTGEGTVSTGTLTFTALNWDTPQTVTVTGVDDGIDDGDVSYSIVLAAATSADGNYNGIDPSDVSVTNTDNDTVGVTVGAISGNTTEAGGTATFTVVLDVEPTASVSIGISSNDAGEGTVSTSSLTFTTGNWSTPQTVTVTGVDDSVDDGDVSYSVVLAAASSSDTAYSGLNPSDVSVTNTDNDTAGVTVGAISGDTTEAGGTATFTIVLDTQPTGNVSIGVSSSDTGEGTVSPSSVTFSVFSWDTPQTVTVTGVNDDIDDGNIVYTVVLAAATSTDVNYSGMDPNDVSVTNTDNDTAGVTVGAISGNTTEAGGTATFTVVLDTEPTADVSIGVSSSDTTEGTVSTSTLTFTALNWSTPQTVTVTGVDDLLNDGDTAYSIVLAAAASADGNYNGLNPADVSVTNTDNEVPGFTVGAISGNTTEAGGTATFTVVLNTAPTNDVVIGVSSNDTTEGTVAITDLTFTSGNWNTPQTVTVTGVNDDLDDGNIAYSIVLAAATSADADYNGQNPDDVSVTNTDNDTSGITVGTISGNTTEAGGTATFTVVLDAEPTADVTIAVSSNDTGEGTVSTGTLTFTALNWSTPQTVTVTGVDDAVSDGDIAYTVILAAATSADSNYSGMNPSDVSVTNVDDDVEGFTVSSISGNTTEAGGTATFTVVLNTLPSSDVSIGVSSSDTGEGTVSTASLTFTTLNWDTPQTVTVTGVNDDVDDGNIAYTIVLAAATSADVNYDGLNPSDVSVTNTDNDTRGFSVSAISGNTTEAGGTATFTIVLASEPVADVTISVTSSDAGEGTASTSVLSFTPLNWDTPQTVTVTGVNDDIDDGNVTYSIVLGAATSGDSNYSGLNPSDVSVINTDDDTAGFTVGTISGNTTEAGGSASFTVVLTAQPTANVVIGVSSSDATEGTVSVSTLTFTSVDWNTPQTVIVTGVDDDVDDGDVSYSAVLGAATSGDAAYNSLNPSDASVINTDNDTSGFTVSAISGNTTEAGGTATFTVVLNSEPLADVTTGISSSDTTEGTVSPSSLTFTAANWDTPQTVTVTGVNDDLDDGDISFTVVVGVATSLDELYDGINPNDVTVTNTDNDIAGFTISSISGNTTEVGGTATFTVQLNTEPTADVSIGVSSDDMGEGTISTATLTFTSGDWNTPQTVTVTGIDDDLDDGDVSYSIVLATASSADGTYDAMNPNDVTVVNTDNDTSGFSVSTISGNTTEAGGTATFTVVLTAEPTADVSTGVSSSDETEGTVSTATLTFTALNWDTPQTVTVTGVDDDVDDGDIAYTIVLAAATSADTNYDAIDPSDVSVTTTDDDVSASSGGSGYIPPSTSGGATVESRSISLLSPSSGSVFTGNTEEIITWTSSGTAMSYVDLYYSLNGGSTFVPIAYSQLNDGIYTWFVPNVGASEVQIKIIATDLVLELATDTSDAFSIVMAPGTEEETPEETDDAGEGVLEQPEYEVSPVTGEFEEVTKVNVGDYIRSPYFNTVYYIAEDLARHPFPNPQIYFTHQDSFDAVKMVTDATLTTIPLGAPMLPKAQTVLVKIQSVSKVYAIEEGNVLRWIPSENAARTLYGSAWADYVIDIEPTFFELFTFGPDMTAFDVVDLTLMKRREDLHE